MNDLKQAMVKAVFHIGEHNGPIWLKVLDEGPLNLLRNGQHIVRFHDGQYLEDVARETMRALDMWAKMAKEHGHKPYLLPMFVEHEEKGVSWGWIDHVVVLTYKGKKGLWVRTWPSPAVRLAIELGHIDRVSPHIKYEYLAENGELFSPFLREVSFTATPLIKRLGSIDDYINATLQASITLAVAWAIKTGEKMDDEQIAMLEEFLSNTLQPFFDGMQTMQQQLSAMQEEITALKAEMSGGNGNGNDDDTTEGGDDIEAGDGIEAGDDKDTTANDLAANDNNNANVAAMIQRLEQKFASLQLSQSQTQAQLRDLAANDQAIGNPSGPPQIQVAQTPEEYFATLAAQGLTPDEQIQKSLTDPMFPG